MIFPREKLKCLRVVPDRTGELHPAAEYERPIAEWIADGFTELSIYCAHCRMVAPRPFSFLCAGRDPAKLCLTDFLEKLRCSRCGQPPSSINPEKPTPTMRLQYGYPVPMIHEPDVD